MDFNFGMFINFNNSYFNIVQHNISQKVLVCVFVLPSFVIKHNKVFYQMPKFDEQFNIDITYVDSTDNAKREEDNTIVFDF